LVETLQDKNVIKIIGGDMIFRKNETGLCPFNKMKPCNDRCELFRSGIHYTEDGKQQIPFKGCVFGIALDNIEVMHNRMFTMQKEVGEQKNMVAMKLLSELGYCGEAKAISEIVKTVERSEDYIDGETLLEDKGNKDG
jgi:hypothetical protein